MRKKVSLVSGVSTAITGIVAGIIAAVDNDPKAFYVAIGSAAISIPSIAYGIYLRWQEDCKPEEEPSQVDNVVEEQQEVVINIVLDKTPKQKRKENESSITE